MAIFGTLYNRQKVLTNDPGLKVEGTELFEDKSIDFRPSQTQIFLSKTPNNRYSLNALSDFTELSAWNSHYSQKKTGVIKLRSLAAVYAALKQKTLV
jgi:hypothetical protein